MRERADVKAGNCLSAHAEIPQRCCAGMSKALQNTPMTIRARKRYTTFSSASMPILALFSKIFSDEKQFISRSCDGRGIALSHDAAK